MKIKSQNERWQPSLGAAMKRSVWRPGCFSCVVIGLFLAVSPASGADDKKPLTPRDPNSGSVRENDLLIAASPTALPARQLWQARISASQEQEASSNKKELQRIIRQINAVEFSHRPAAPEPKAAVKTAPKAEPNETAPAAKRLPAPAVNKAEKKLPDGFVSEQTLQLFNSRIGPLVILENPLEMADILFNSGCLKEAAICYQQALDHPAADAPDVLENKAWALLQLGNCLRKENPQAALEKYKAVIIECPDSFWEDLAKAKCQFVEWYLKDQPTSLVENVKL